MSNSPKKQNMGINGEKEFINFCKLVVENEK